MFFGLLFPKIYVPSLGWELEKMTSFSQKYHLGWNYNNHYQAILINNKNFGS